MPHDPPNLVELSRTLGNRVGMKRDSTDTRTFATALLQQMIADGLIWAVAPVDIGGPGLSVEDTARIVANVARLSPSAGLIYAMHMSQALTVVRHAQDNAYIAGQLRRFVADQTLVASGTSEKNVGGDIFGSVCTVARQDDGRLSLIKESPNISYMDLAGAILVSAMIERDNGTKSQVLACLETADLTVEPGAATGFLGMNGILNLPYRLSATFPEAALFGDEYSVIARETMTPSVHIFWAASWSGIASAALDKARHYLGTQKLPDEDFSTALRIELSQLVDKHYVMNALIRDGAVDFDRHDASVAMGMGHTARVKRLKTVCSQNLEDICLGVLGILGMRGYAESGPYSLAEIIQDALSARVMISNYRLLTSNAKIERFVLEKI
jgi:acyl-CoA dehydrogenase